MVVLLLVVLIPLFSPPAQVLILLSAFYWSITQLAFKPLVFGLCSYEPLSWGLVTLTLGLLLLMLVSCPTDIKLTSLLSCLSLILCSLVMAGSLVVFYILFEASLIPMALIILGWGGQPERVNASVYMVMYTITSSLPFLIIILHLHEVSFVKVAYTDLGRLGGVASLWVMLPFMVKSPVFMFHLWLPKAHVEASSSGSMVLAGVLLKVGSFGIWKLSPLLMGALKVSVCTFSLVGGALCSVVACCQVDVKSLIAYSSVVHMALVVLACGVSVQMGNVGAYLMMLGHGVCSSGLFYAGTSMYSRVGSRSLVMSNGMLFTLSSLSLGWVALILANLSAPPVINFVGEVSMIALSTMKCSMFVLPVGLMVVLVLLYSLTLYTSCYHGDVVWLKSIEGSSIQEMAIVGVHAGWFVVSPWLCSLLI